MLEAKLDLWDTPANVKCILTNGIVNNGKLVMGGGCALEAAQRYPELPRFFGTCVETFDNSVWPYLKDGQWLFSFPTKHHYKDPSDLELIRESSLDLMHLLDTMESTDFTPVCLLPRPGCGLGGLDWDTEVKPLIEPILDDRVTVIYK